MSKQFKALSVSQPMVDFLTENPEYATFMQGRITEGLLQKIESLNDKIQAYECLAVACATRASVKDKSWFNSMIVRYTDKLDAHTKEMWLKLTKQKVENKDDND